MRKFLLILACALSFCVHAETNIVQVEQEQWKYVSRLENMFLRMYYAPFIEQNSDGSITFDETTADFSDSFSYLAYNQYSILQLLHLIFTGSLDGSYDISTNNVLAYASSLHDHNADVREYLDSIDANSHGIWTTLVGQTPYLGLIRDNIIRFRQDYTNNLQRIYYNYDRIYDAITNIDFKVSISNQIDLLQVMNGNLSNLDGILQDWSGNQQANFGMVVDHMHRDHAEVMDFFHSLSNSVLFASNLCNCCGGSNSNYQDSVIAMLDWMTNNFPDVAESPIGGGGGGSNNVWSIWRPSGVPSSGWFHLFVPSVEWVQSGEDAQQYKPRYGNYQYDSVYNSVWEEYYNLLENYRANGIDGQRFLAGLVDLQLHIMANMSTQLYMIDQKMPSKTNLWDWIESYKRTISDEVTQAEQENSEIVSSVSYLLDYTPFGIVGGHFPKVSSALNSLRLEQGASPVLRIPIPSVLRVSDSDALVVDVRESEWFTTGRTWCRWIFTFIWGWLFIRLGIVPIFYVFFFTVRVAEISAHLVFMGSVRGSSGIVSSFGAAAVDMVLSLIGIDTDFKKFVWGIMRD